MIPKESTQGKEAVSGSRAAWMPLLAWGGVGVHKSLRFEDPGE